MTAILVLYENPRAASGSFGLHELLVALVADELSATPLQLRKRVRARPLNGVNNLLKAIRDPQRLAPAGGPCLAVIDADRIRKCLRMPGAGAKDVISRILQSCEEPARITVVLLERNVESLIEAVRECDRAGSLPIAVAA